MDRVVQLLIVSGTAGCALAQFAAPAPLVDPFSVADATEQVVNVPVEDTWAAVPEEVYNVGAVDEGPIFRSGDEIEWLGDEEEVSVQSLPSSIDLARAVSSNTVQQASKVAGAAVQSVANTVSTVGQGLSSLVEVPYTGFDLVESADHWQRFRNRALGITGPDYVAYIQSFNGADLLNRLSGMRVQPLVAAILDAFNLPDVGQLLKSIQGMNVSVFLPVILKSLKDRATGPAAQSSLTSPRSLQDIIVGLNPRSFAQKLQAAGVPEFIQQYTGLDVSSYFSALATYDGQRLLASLQAISGSDLEQLARDMDAQDYFADYLGLDTEPLFRRLRNFSLANFLASDKLAEGLLAVLDDVIAVALETFREMAAALTSSTVRAPNGEALSVQSGGLDALHVVSAAEKLLDKVLGRTGTDLVGIIRAIDLPTVAPKVQSIEMSTIIANVESTLNSMTAAQREQLVNQVLSVLSEVWTWLNGLTGQKIIDSIASATGQTTLDRIAALNLGKYASMVIDYGLVGPIQQVTGIDLTPLLQTIAAINIMTVVDNLRRITGSDLVQFMDDAGISDYLTGAGFNMASLRSVAGVVSGAGLVDQLLNVSGRQLLEEVRTMDGSGLANWVNEKANKVLTLGAVLLKFITPSAASVQSGVAGTASTAVNSALNAPVAAVQAVAKAATPLQSIQLRPLTTAATDTAAKVATLPRNIVLSGQSRA